MFQLEAVGQTIRAREGDSRITVIMERLSSILHVSRKYKICGVFYGRRRAGSAVVASPVALI